MADRQSMISRRFQSAPLVAEGRCPPAFVVACCHAVSIRTPRCRGAMPTRRPRRRQCPSCFNPHPSLPRGDAEIRAGRVQQLNAFQSAPLVAEGRCTELMRTSGRQRWFQSAPLVAEGRCECDRVTGGRDAGFNPHPSLPRGDACWSSRIARSMRSFQSAPLVAEGRCLQARTILVRLPSVSIRTPRCRGAMPPACGILRVSTSGFNPHPSLPRGDASACPACIWSTWRFNPHPSLPRGDASNALPSDHHDHRFNPHPSLPRGDAVFAGADEAGTDVSIRTPRCRGAMQADVLDAVAFFAVSIRTPRCRGAMRPRRFRRSARRCFNPHPSLPRGDARVMRCALQEGAGFNPHPSLPRGDAGSCWPPEESTVVSIRTPRCRGAMPSVRRRMPCGRGVSIRTPRCRGAMLDQGKALLYSRLFQSAPLVAEGRCDGRPDADSLPGGVSIRTPRCRGAMPFGV